MTVHFSMLSNKTATLDVIAIGRAGVDLYATEHNTDFEQVQSFQKFVGGSPANTLAALAKRGAKTALISKLSNDAVGSYVMSYLRNIGVDVSHISYTKGEERTSLALTEMKPEKCQVVIYRNNAADLLLEPKDIDESFIASSRILLISGAALSKSPSREAVFIAAHYARKHSVPIAFDIDHRPYSWNSPEESALYCSLLAEQCSIIIGNRSEFNAIEYLWDKYNTEDKRTASRFFAHAAKLVVIKHGKSGSQSFTRDGLVLRTKPYPAPNIKKPFGAGDAFAGNLLYELLAGKPLETALDRASAAAAIVISKDSCSAASPDSNEIDNLQQNKEK